MRGLLSHDNVEELRSKQYGYILGARIKNESQAIKEKILALKLKNGESTLLIREWQSHLIHSRSLKSPMGLVFG
jgi:hypothetical protein